MWRFPHFREFVVFPVTQAEGHYLDSSSLHESDSKAREAKESLASKGLTFPQASHPEDSRPRNGSKGLEEGSSEIELSRIQAAIGPSIGDPMLDPEDPATHAISSLPKMIGDASFDPEALRVADASREILDVGGADFDPEEIVSSTAVNDRATVNLGDEFFSPEDI